MHSHAVSVGARLASVDPLSTSFLLPNQVISEVGRIFHPGDSYRCMHDMKATSSVLITSDASFDLSRASATPRNVAEAFQDRALLGLRCESEWSLGILAKAAWEIFEAETTKAAVKTFYSIDTPAKIQLERWEQYNEYEQDFNEFEPEDDSGEITRNFGHRITSISHKQVLRYRLFQDL